MRTKASIPTIAQNDLFGLDTEQLPSGFRYEADFLTPQEEAHCLGLVQTLPLAAMQYKQYLAKRRVVSFGGRYDFDDHRLGPAPDMPGEFAFLRQKAAAWLGCQPQDLTHMLVAEYRPGTTLGWHRDVPDFESIVGISLGSEATMRLRPFPPHVRNQSEVIDVVLAPRSIYGLSGAARWAWQHKVSATPAWRYSITFRTARQAAGPIPFPSKPPR